MAVLMLLEVVGGTTEQYERANELLGISGDDDAPDGLIYHIAARSDDGIVIADVWRSEEECAQFFSERAGAALAEAGMPEAEPTFAQVHNHVGGTGTAPGALVILDIEELTPEMYDEMAQAMPAHAEGGPGHPAVIHVAATKPDGGMVVVDLWESPEAFGQFAQDQIAPAGEKAGIGQVEPRIHPVHNTLKGETATAQ
jgi:hypothetical protein